MSGSTVLTPAQAVPDGANVDKATLRAFMSANELVRPLFNQTALEEYWGYSPSVTPSGGSQLQLSGQSAAPSPGQPVAWIEAYYSASQPVTVDFAGAYLASVPVGLYVQHVQYGTNGANNVGTHSIMAYGVNAASGDNDCVAVSGRVRKLEVSGGIGDACGVWGSAYAESTENGGTLGMETHIYQNAPGSVAADRLGDKWSVGLHVYSDSTGSAATAGIGIDASGQTAGRFGYWNGIIIDKNCFAGGNIIGTVGINMASCDDFNNPQFGIKFGACWGAQIYSQGQPFTVIADNSIYLSAATQTTQPGGSSVFIQLGNGAGSNCVVQSNGVNVFEVKGSDGSVHIKAGTTIIADL